MQCDRQPPTYHTDTYSQNWCDEGAVENGPDLRPRTQKRTQQYLVRGTIALVGVTMLASACTFSDLSNPESSRSQSPVNSGTPTASLAEPPLTESRITPPTSDEIRAFLEQGSVEDSSQCPSKPTPTGDAIALKKVAYFETTNYWVGICRRSTGELEYYGRKRDHPELDLALLAYLSSDHPQEFFAQNGNTLYTINPTELVVTQNGVPIIREPVVHSSLD